MPKTKLERIFFTAVTAFFMVYGMTIYNTVLANGTFTNRTFLDALTHMWVEYGIIFLLAFFVAGAIAPKLAFWVVQPADLHHFCNSDVYRDFNGGICKCDWLVSCPWIFCKCDSQLYCNLL